jgi:hypothetical protein
MLLNVLLEAIFVNGLSLGWKRDKTLGWTGGLCERKYGNGTIHSVLVSERSSFVKKSGSTCFVDPSSLNSFDIFFS